jgi:hypothetical protein
MLYYDCLQMIYHAIHSNDTLAEGCDLYSYVGLIDDADQPPVRAMWMRPISHFGVCFEPWSKLHFNILFDGFQ